MQRKESLYPKDWFRIGEKELKRARYLLSMEDTTGAGFNIQQAVEKHLKGYLFSKGWKLKRIHDLETLLNEAIRHDPSFEQFRPPCRKMTQYYMEDRYPFTVVSELTENEIQESISAAEKIIAKVIESQ